MLRVDNVKVTNGPEEILRGVSLEVPQGEVHILLGPNGSGKTTLLKAIMGMSLGDYEVNGNITFNEEELSGLSVDERANKGIGIALQKSPTIPEVTLGGVLEMTSKKHGTEEMDEMIDALNCRYLLARGLNENFSGGEMKRSEMLQLMVQNPQLVLVDEPESGVDLDNVTVIGEALKRLIKTEREVDKKKSALVITHTGRIMEYLNADRGYVMVEGRIACSGNAWDLFEEVSKHGYEACLDCSDFCSGGGTR